MTNNNQQKLKPKTGSASTVSKPTLAHKSNQKVERKQGLFPKLSLVIVFCLPVLLYIQTIGFDFTHFDDDYIIINNAPFFSKTGNIPQAFLTDAFIIKSSPFYRPLQTVSYIIDTQISAETHVAMYHFTNVLLLGLIACVLLLFLRRLLLSQDLAFVGTLLYCVHPLFVSSVAWIPARGDLLLTLFTLLSFIFLIEYLQKQKSALLFYHWFAFTVALFCKETAIVLPFLFILYCFSFQHKSGFERKHLFALVLYAISVAVWYVLRNKAIVTPTETDDVLGFSAIFLNIPSIAESFTKFALPFAIAPIPGFSIVRIIIGILLSVGIALLVFKNKERTFAEKLFCLAWYILLVLPPMLFKGGLIDYLDHRFFLPMMGILMFLLFMFPHNWTFKGDTKKTWIAAFVIVFFCVISFSNAGSYANPITFYNAAIAQNEKSALAFNNRAIEKSNKGDKQGALDDYSQAIALNTSFAKAYNNKGTVLGSLGKFAEALKNFDKAIAINKNYREAYCNRGIAKYYTKDLSGAMADCEKTLSLSHNDNMALALEAQIKEDLKKNVP